MSTSLLYHAWGLHGYRHVSIHFQGERSTSGYNQLNCSVVAAVVRTR